MDPTTQPEPVLNQNQNATNTKFARIKQKLYNGRPTPILFVLVFAVIGSSALLWSYAATITYSLWSDSTVPKNITATDTHSVELGLKFQSKYSGQVVGVRFYKGPHNIGTHTGALWNSAGNKPHFLSR
jgi:hypothetical protein